MDLLTQLIAQAKQTPYFHLKDETTGEIYMERYWLVPPGEGVHTTIRLHHTKRSDHDRALHDHPMPSTSIILAGGFWEIMPEDQDQPCSLDLVRFQRIWRKPGDVVTRKASDRHRLQLPEGETCWSMFIMGPKEQNWGFYDPTQGYRYWREYLDDWTTESVNDSMKNE